MRPTRRPVGGRGGRRGDNCYKCAPRRPGLRVRGGRCGARLGCGPRCGFGSRDDGTKGRVLPVGATQIRDQHHHQRDAATRSCSSYFHDREISVINIRLVLVSEVGGDTGGCDSTRRVRRGGRALADGVRGRTRGCSDARERPTPGILARRAAWNVAGAAIGEDTGNAAPPQKNR